jgi:hypothetical protein
MEWRLKFPQGGHQLLWTNHSMTSTKVTMSGFVINHTRYDVFKQELLPFLKGRTAACKPTIESRYIGTMYQLKGPATKSVTNLLYL